MRPVSPADFRDLAKRRLPRFLFDYIDGGSYSESAMRRNLTDLAAIELRQQVMVDVSTIDLSTELFGQRLDLPVLLGPVGLAGMAARRGEVQAARAAEAAGVPFCLSTVSVCPLEEVARAVRRPLWLQLYMLQDRGFIRDLLFQAKGQGCSTLVMTVDLPMAGVRYRDYRSGLAGAPGTSGAIRRALQGASRPQWAWDVGMRGRPHSLGNVAPVLEGRTGLEDFFGWVGRNFDPAFTWKDLDFIRSEWNGTLVLKGILDAEDAHAAAEQGADGIVVSNHGGRQLDCAPSTARALPAIAETVGDRLAVLVDGGVRSGVDVARMLALGARGVLLGRAWVYALGACGEAGVAQLLELIRAELRATLALAGQKDVRGVNASMLSNATMRGLR